MIVSLIVLSSVGGSSAVALLGYFSYRYYNRYIRYNMDDEVERLLGYQYGSHNIWDSFGEHGDTIPNL